MTFKITAALTVTSAIFAVLLTGCSKEPEPVPPSMAMLDEAGAGSAAKRQKSSPAITTNNVPEEYIDCLASRLEETERIIKITEPGKIKQPYPYETGIAAERLMYWGMNAFISETCAQMPTYNAFDGPVSYNPFEAIDRTTKKRIDSRKAFKPSEKGEFETTADYSSRIAQEKAAHESATAGTGYNVNDLIAVWDHVMGSPLVKWEGRNGYLPKYDPDTETMEMVISSKLAQKISPTGDATGSLRFPVKIKVSRQSAQAFFEVFDKQSFQYRPSLSILMPHVAMELVGDRIIVREVSLLQHPEANDIQKKIVTEAIAAGGLNFERMKVDYEIPYSFGR